MMQELISMLTSVGLTVKFSGGQDRGNVCVTIMAPDITHPRGGAVATSPEKALVIAVTRGLVSLYHGMRSDCMALEESEALGEDG